MSITVIIPVYNGEKFIAQALESIFSQTVAARQVIVIDDGSVDNSANIVGAYGSRVQYVYQKNSGISAARNAGIALANSTFISFLDQDDLYLPHKFELSLTAFDLAPEADVIQGKWRYLFDNQSLEMRFMFQDQIDKATYGPLLGTALFKKSLFDKIGLFDEGIRFSDDVDLFMRIKDSGLEIKQIEDLCLLYRYHENNTTKSADFQTEHHRDMLKLLYKSIQMKRRGQNASTFD